MLKKIVKTRWNYWLGFFVDGLTVFFMLHYVLHLPDVHYFWVLSLVFAGILIFSLIEYLVHAKLFHARPGSIFKMFVLGHIAHHKNPMGYDSLPFFFSSFILVLLASFFSLFFPVTINFSIAAGILTGYIGYGLLHFLIHHYQWKRGYLNYLQNFHDIHHLKSKTNMGVSSPLWDYIFGTRQ